MKFLIINGPNLNMLGIREKEIYGSKSLKDLERYIRSFAKENDISTSFYFSNCEGELVTRIQKAYKKFDGIVINPGAYSHYSIAILDALKAVSIPYVEVHLSDVDNREEFRRVNYIRSVCDKTITNLREQGYVEAVNYLQKVLNVL